MRFAAPLLVSLTFISLASAAEPKPPEWGEAKNGLRTRLSAERQSFRAGEPISMTLEIENVTDRLKTYRMPVIPFSHTLIVVDERGKEAPYLGGLSGVLVDEKELKPGESQKIRSFELSDLFYLRRPGRYTVKSQDETHKEAPAPFEFDVTADRQLAIADGDPVGKLLPLVRKNEWLIAGPNKPRKLNPGGNRGEVMGRTVSFLFDQESPKNNPKMVWIWLTDEAAAMRGANLNWPPPSEDLGMVDRWQVYMYVSADADKEWPTAREDIKRALGGPQKRAELKPSQWGEPKNGLRTRLVSEKQIFRAGDKIPMKLEMENVSNEIKEFQSPVAPHHGTLSVLDETGAKMPFILGPAQVAAPPAKLNPGQAREFNSFDLAAAFYLRKPGRYTVQSTEQPISAPLEFEVTANPEMIVADGDPIGRLLPLVKKDWWLSGGAAGAKVRPGSNHAQIAGRCITLIYDSTGYKKDTGVVLLWLTDEKAVEKEDKESSLPAAEYLGKLSRWHGYITVTENAQKAWPTAKDDIKRNLEDKPELAK